MRIVLGHASFDAIGGTETYMLTVAKELQALGHDVTIYGAGELGMAASQAKTAGLAVTNSLDQLPDECDATLANDSSSAFDLAAKYPAATRAMVVHSSYFQLQSPPQIEGVCDLVIALSDRIVKHVECLAFHPPVARLRQPVDTLRFGPRGDNPSVARRALVLGNYFQGAGAEQVTNACASAGVEAVFAGLSSDFSAEPERAIAEADLVIGLGRCIVEAMAGRRAAYVFGIAGGDGWVTADSYEQLEADGFGGGGTSQVISYGELARDLADWSPQMGAVNRQLALARHDAADHARELIELLSSVDERRPAIAPEAAAENARLVRAEWLMRTNWMQSIDENRELSRQNRELLDLLDQERDAFQALTQTRRYRLATALLAPIDWVRRTLRR
jgi:hypothetical protein